MKQWMGLFAIGLVAGAMVSVLTGSASAKYERFAGISCKLQNPYNQQANYVSDSGWGTWLENRHTANEAFICPMPEETGLLPSNITTIVMTVYDNHTAAYVLAKVCGLWETEGNTPKAKITNSGIACAFEGANTSLSYVGPGTLSLPLTSSSLAALELGETIYVFGRLPSAQNGNYSRIQSLYTWAN